MKECYKTRVINLQEKIQGDGYLIQNPIDLYYFTGLDLSAGKLLVMKNTVQLLVDGRYFETAKSLSPFSTQLDRKDLLLELIPSGSSIQIDSEKTSLQQYLDLVEQLGKKSIKVIGEKGAIASLRAIKDDDEIALLKSAAELGSIGYDYVLGCLRNGITEKEIADELELFWKKRGAKGAAFDPIIAFGANSSMPHYRAGQAVLNESEPVLIDIGVTLNHYHSDMTRVALRAVKDDKIREIFDIVAQAHELAKEKAKSGASIASLDEAARSYIASKGYGEQFSHSLGHGIGLEVHEYPTIRNNADTQNQFLQKGMVITIEPGIYLPGIGGVRIEDTVLVKDDGCESLTKRAFT